MERSRAASIGTWVGPPVARSRGQTSSRMATVSRPCLWEG